MQHSTDMQEQHIERFGNQNKEENNEINEKSKNNPLWSMNFDGSCTKNDAGVSIWIHNTENSHDEGHSYRLNFQCTNNIAELIIKQVNGEYSAKHHRLRAYRDYAMELLKFFDEFKLIFVPRNQNFLANGLAFAGRTCLTPYKTK